jgi:predicted nucleic acid-binding protein
MVEKFGRGVNRQTFYKHKPHALGTEVAVVQAASKALTKADIKKTSNVAFLEAVRDIGYTKAISDPDQISIDHALKAATILETRKDKPNDALNVLIQVVVGQQMPAFEVEGEYREME